MIYDDICTEDGLFMDSVRKERMEARFYFVSYPVAFESLTKAGIEGKTMQARRRACKSPQRAISRPIHQLGGNALV